MRASEVAMNRWLSADLRSELAIPRCEDGIDLASTLLGHLSNSQACSRLDVAPLPQVSGWNWKFGGESARPEQN